MSRKIKRMNIKEFVDEGFLQEANRQFFHPLGLALEVATEDNQQEPWRLSGVWDYRDDPDGMFFGEGIIDGEKKRNVRKLRSSKMLKRSRTPNCDEDGIQEK